MRPATPEDDKCVVNNNWGTVIRYNGVGIILLASIARISADFGFHLFG